MKGNVTKIVASTIPGTAKMICMLCAVSQPPNQPWLPKSRTYVNPATTGEIENGRSTSEISRLLPKNSNLPMAHAAATPKTRLQGTAMNAASSVSRIDESVSGSRKVVR